MPSSKNVDTSTQLSDGELTSILDEGNYLSELSVLMNYGMLSGAVESCSVMAPQQTLRQPAQPARPSAASDSQLAASVEGEGCPSQVTYVEKPLQSA